MVGYGYSYGFQGQEKDDEIKGEGNSINYKYRMHDPRVGRFFAIDPLASIYPHNSPYAFSENVVINAVELEGLEKLEIIERQGEIVLTLIDVTAEREIVNKVDKNNVTTHKHLVYKELKEAIGDFSANKHTGEFITKNKTYKDLNSGPGNVITPQFKISITDHTKLEKKPIAGKGLYASGHESVEGAFSAFEISEPLFNEKGEKTRDKIIPDKFDYVNIYINPEKYTQEEAMEALGKRVDLSKTEVFFKETPFDDNDQPDPDSESDITLGFGTYE